MSVDVPPAKLANVGVLFVHGMGEQQRADTLIQFGEPLQRWLERWLRERDTNATVRVTRAELAESDGPRPAYAELHIHANGSDSTWLLAEAWWAASFRAPTYADLWRWSLGVVPVTVLEHFVRRFRLAATPYHRMMAWLLAAAAIVMLPLATLIILTSLVIGVIPIAPLRTAILRFQKMLVGTVGDSYVLLESSIRDGAMSASVERDLCWLKAKATKTVVVAHSQGAAVTHTALQATTVRPDLLFTFGSGLRKLLVLEAIRGSNRFIVWLPPVGLLLMAAGSWLCYHLLVDPSARVNIWAYQTTVDINGYVDSFTQAIGFNILSWRSVLTAGALAGAVTGAIVGEDSIGDRLISALFFGLAGIFMASFLRAMVVSGPPFWVAISVFGLGSAAVEKGISVLKGDAYDRINGQVALDPPVSWIDRYAVSDPVPNGPLSNTAADVVDSQKVWNRNSLLRDHTSYWQNADQFVAAVATAIAGVAGVELKEGWDEQRLRRAEQRRRWRVGWLSALRIAALLVGGLLAWRFREGPWHQVDEMSWLPRTVFAETIDLLEKIPFIRLLVTDWTKSALLQLLWPVSLLLSVWLIYRFFAAVWTVWDFDDTRRLFLRQNYALFPPAFVAMLAIAGAALAMSFGFALSFDHQLMAAWARDPNVLAMRSDFWKTYFQLTPQGALMACLGALVAAAMAAYACVMAKIFTVWGGRDADPFWMTGQVIAYASVALPVTLGAAWIMFGLSSDPPSPPYPDLLVVGNGFGATAGLLAIGAVTVSAVSWALESRAGSALRDRLHQYSASGPLGLWLARPAAAASSRADLTLRASQMVAEWDAVKRPDVRIAADFNREAIAIVRAGALLPDSVQLLALTRVFPYAAIAAADAVVGDNPTLARVILEPHRTTAPFFARWRIRRIRKRLAGTPPDVQVV